MWIFSKKSRAGISRAQALRATKGIIQDKIDSVAKNGHFHHSMTIRKEFMDGRNLAKDIVPVLKEEFVKEGYVVLVDESNFIINW